jgi:uncharacterized protein YlxW (UPF0749 family)
MITFTPSMISLGVECFLALLLMIAIAYCMKLDGKLKALRTGNSRMMEAAKELTSSVLHAENAVQAMRRSADAAGRELQNKIDEARAMAQQPLIREVMLDDSRGHGRDGGRESGRDVVKAPVDFSLRRRSVL